jgi:ketosteroid isomerase-like protein
MPFTNNEEAVSRVLDDYYSAFSTLDVQAVLPYFQEPALLIGPGGMFMAPTRAALPTAFTPTMEGLRARGYARSELSMRDVKSLNVTTTLVDGVAIRYKLDGQELDRAGVTYVLLRADSNWKIAVLILHDKESAQPE